MFSKHHKIEGIDVQTDKYLGLNGPTLSSLGFWKALPAAELL